MLVRTKKKTTIASPGSGSSRKRTVLVTGASGRIGSHFSEVMKDHYDLKLMVKEGQKDEAEHLHAYGEVHEGKLEDVDRLKSLFKNVDTILHLAAEPSAYAVWEDLHRDNIVGTYNVLAAAKFAGCRRVVFASSVHAVMAYPPEVQVKTHEPVAPGDLYGVTKVFGEALGRYMAEREGLSFIAIRIGAFQPREKLLKQNSTEALSIWVSPSDLVQLFRRAIDDETLQFGIFHGVSNNRYNYLDISDAREVLGYEPEGDAFAERPEIPDWTLPETPADTGKIDPSDSGLRKDE